ncbi:MAG: thermonuclease family protein [Acidimicrobiales bacterium]
MGGHRRLVATTLAVVLAVAAAGCVRGAPAGTAAPASVAPRQPTSAATVVRTVDGDTVVVRPDGQGAEATVRLIGIDTPETKKPNTPVECFGTQASARLADLLPPGAAVLLEPDVEARDRYGRQLAYVHRSDGLFVNLAMVADGYADGLTIAPNVAHEPELRAAVRAARDTRAGLWGTCPGPHSPQA